MGDRRAKWAALLRKMEENDQTLKTLTVDGMTVKEVQESGVDANIQWISCLRNNTALKKIIADDVGMNSDQAATLFLTLSTHLNIKVRRERERGRGRERKEKFIFCDYG